MAKEIIQVPFRQTLPSGQGKRIKLDPVVGVIRTIQIHWPDGCNGLVGVAVKYGSRQILPVQSAGYLSLNDCTPTWTGVDYQVDKANIWVDLQNADQTWKHTVTVIVGVEVEAGVETGNQSIEAYTVPTTGVGRPDYTREVSLGQVRAGISLKYNEQLLVFASTPTSLSSGNPYPWTHAPLASGSALHLVNVATGLPMPYNVPAGYGLAMVEQRPNFNQLWVGEIFLDNFITANVGLAGPGVMIDENPVLSFTTLLVDPTAASAHSVDYQVLNLGGSGDGSLIGGIQATCILSAIGTPPFPTEKDTRCPFCGKINRVPVEQTVVVCSCGKTYYLYAPSALKRSQ